MERARQYLPGGVSSNFRLGVSPHPLVIKRGGGAHVIDADDNELIDYYLGMGPLILGHKPKGVIDAVCSQLDRGVLFAGQT
jgi:glutamate-1-semialdehyde 2,1-aminomutase